jgi:predicted nucleic acid-binding protein
VNYLVLDTDVVSYLYGNRPEAAKFEHHLRGARLAVAFATVAELQYGAHHCGWSDERVRDLDVYLRRFRVLPFTRDVPLLWARLRDHASRVGHPLAHRNLSNDLWIAACAIQHRAPLVTGNARHFLDLPGLDLRTTEN